MLDENRHPLEEQFKDAIGRYETPDEIAQSLLISAEFFRALQPTSVIPQPRLVGDFHHRAALALQRLIKEVEK